MNKTTKIIGGIIVIAVIVILVAVFYKPASKEAIKIGAILPLTGKGASLGEYTRNAIDLASEEINKEKEIIEIVYEDEKCDPKEAVSAYRTLRLKDVNIIIGAVCSPSTLAIAPLAEEDKVILMTPASGANSISDAGDFIFRNHLTASKKVKEIAKFSAEKFDKAAIIYDQSNDAYVIAKDTFAQEFENRGGVITKIQGFQNNSTDFKTELAKIKQSGPQVIYLGALMPQSAQIIKQIEELGINSTIVAEDATATDGEFINSTGNLSEGIIFSGVAFNRETAPEFWNNYKDNFGNEPNIYAAQAYDSLMILADIINTSCKAKNTNCIKNELYKIKDYKGVSGLTTFDENGDVVKPVTIKIIKNGKFVPLED